VEVTYLDVDNTVRATSPWAFTWTWSGFWSRTRRTISRAVTARLRPREANPVNGTYFCGSRPHTCPVGPSCGGCL
jgi:hypothetical protein